MADKELNLLVRASYGGSTQQLSKRRRIYASTGSAANIMIDRESLSEWAKDKPLSILQLDPADRAVLRIAGERKCEEKEKEMHEKCLSLQKWKHFLFLLESCFLFKKRFLYCKVF